MLQELLAALKAQGAFYEVAVQGLQYDVEAPGLLSNTYICIQAVNHVAILARTDLDPGAVDQVAESRVGVPAAEPRVQMFEIRG